MFGDPGLEETDALADAAMEATFDRVRSARTAQLKDVQKEGASLGKFLRARIEEKAKALRESLEKPQQPDQPSNPEEQQLPVEVPCELVLDWRKGK